MKAIPMLGADVWDLYRMVDKSSCQPPVRFTGQWSRLRRMLLAVQQRQSPTPDVAGRVRVRVVRVAAGHIRYKSLPFLCQPFEHRPIQVLTPRCRPLELVCLLVAWTHPRVGLRYYPVVNKSCFARFYGHEMQLGGSTVAGRTRHILRDTKLGARFDEEQVLEEMDALARNAGSWAGHVPYGAVRRYGCDPVVRSLHRSHVDRCGYCRQFIEVFWPGLFEQS